MYCYLGICKGRSRQDIKRELVGVEGLLRITDHETHLKVISEEELPPIVGFATTCVEDKTGHWDVHYWDIAMEGFCYAVKKGHDRKALDVLVHYLCNLFGEPEQEYYEYLAKKRRLIDANTAESDGQDWEREALKEAGLWR